MKTVRAFIFDFFGTLVPNFRGSSYDATLEQMARVLAVDAFHFQDSWRNTFDERASGRLTVLQNIEEICRDCGIGVRQINQAARIWMEGISALEPQPEALALLSHLRSAGYKIGLITDCSDELPRLWPHSAFFPLVDVATFSCQVGTKKPDASIYLVTCEALGVSPTECIYVGDGGSTELTGAQAVGMWAVLLADGRDDDVLYGDEIASWSGETLSSLAGLTSRV